MHNRYLIEGYDGKQWVRISWIGYYSFQDALKPAKTYLKDYDKVRIVDECYGMELLEMYREE